VKLQGWDHALLWFKLVNLLHPKLEQSLQTYRASMKQDLPMVAFPFSLCAFCKRTICWNFPSLGHKHIMPPKNCNHKYNLFAITNFGNVWTSHLKLLFCFKYIWLTWNSIYSIFLKIQQAIKRIECMEYICHKIIHFTKFEKIAHILQN
jgi:hypothetical protein